MGLAVVVVATGVLFPTAASLGLIKNLDIGLALEVEGEAVCSLGVDTTFVGRIRRGVIALI